MVGRRRGARVWLLALPWLALTALPAAADVSTGWQAYIDQDYVTAEREWRPLAEQGNRDAAFGLGLMSQAAGRPEQAARWYEQAGQQGITAAQVLLGAMYADGLGVPRDPVRAYAWLNLAVDDGHPNAALARDAVGATLAPAQIAEAKRLSAQLRKK